MAREHKARLWDEDNKVLSFIDLLDLEATIQALDSFRDYFGATYFRLHPEYWMDFTGLKDKKGKEIFNSDIISVDELDTSHPTKGKQPIIQSFPKSVVVWSNSMCCFMYNPIRKGASYINYSHQMLCYGGNIQVIGNIYENPELIQQPL